MYVSSDARALIRLQADHTNRHIVPSFYRYLQAQDTDAQIAGGKEFADALEGLVELFERAAREADTESGMWYGGELGLADVLVAPCMSLKLVLCVCQSLMDLTLGRAVPSDERPQALSRLCFPWQIRPAIAIRGLPRATLRPSCVQGDVQH